jgi:hypothetical protein
MIQILILLPLTYFPLYFPRSSINLTKLHPEKINVNKVRTKSYNHQTPHTNHTENPKLITFSRGGFAAPGLGNHFHHYRILSSWV